ncbi:hypothetical protein LVD17_01240 [Fulvivirga ulvae]|uniref:hypothetical protein n=1 Tax=Fulvivirga ulvae TaxID=2904245 RepID=UPI001F1CD2E3|nr:hypothetical protein [Fulvivirga ulvae]UII32463.1 hypothetical protein LVD17_01240 [Fulvivirga ulvae]
MNYYNTTGEYLKVRYWVDGGIHVFGQREPFAFLQDGEEYIVKYMHKNPSYLVVYYDRPVFSEGVEYQTVSCASLVRSYGVVDFRYIVNDTEYRRRSPYKEGQSLQSNDYRVKFRVDNPRIGYLVEKVSAENDAI